MFFDRRVDFAGIGGGRRHVPAKALAPAGKANGAFKDLEAVVFTLRP